MSSNLDEQIKQLKHHIRELESQRGILGDETVEAALIPLQNRLSELDSQAEQAAEISPAMPARQRKLVTLLYMDVVGSTAMTRELDPEDNLELMENALLRLVDPVQAHGGRVTRYTGDGFKALFGDPVAREDDPEQAIRAGLEMLDVSKELAQEIEKEWEIRDFQVRIGIDTGLAALGGQTEAEDTVKGRVVNLAVRIESAAPPGGLLISHNTYRHVRGVFNVEPLEPITAKGFPEPVPVYLVRELKPRAFRVQTRGVEGVETRMIGRHDELKYLQDALLTAIEEGEGQVVTICGEAGVGKSRLLYEFQNWIELQPPTHAVRFFLGRGRQEAQGLPYSLLRDLFAFRFQVLDDDTGEQVRRKIESGFCDVFGQNEAGVMRAHILGQLLGFDFSASPHLKGVLNDPEQLRNRARMYLVGYFQELVKEIPVVIFLEDLHWADDSSLDMVMHLGEFTPQLPILAVSAARPTLFERRPYWGEGQAFHKQLALHPLSKRESRHLVSEILKFTADIPPELRELVVSGAEGNPFYLEELVKMLIEEGVVIPGEETWGINLSRLEEVDVPATLAGVLQARLDSLPPQERIVLQQASVVGRLFWDRIVTYIQAEGEDGGDPQLIPHALISLRNRELVYRHEESAFVGAVEYLFKHDVLREVTYESVVKRLRKTYHGLVADWLIDNSGDRMGEYSGLIAEHLLQAGKDEHACEYFFQAGETALASYANAEAEIFYRQAMELSPQDSLRADLLTGLGESILRQGNYEQAKLSWKMAIIIYRDTGNNDRTADVYARLSELLWDWEGYDIAWNVCQEGLEAIEGAPDSSGYARLLAEAGRMAFMRNLTDEIRPLCQRASEMAERVGELEVVADTRITLALIEEDITKAVTEMEEVVDFAEEQSIIRSAVRAHLDLGYLLSTYMIDMHLAEQHTLQSIKISKQNGDIGVIKMLYGNVCDSMIWMGQLNQAEQLINEFFSETSLPGTRNAYYYQDIRALLLFTRGKWKQAKEVNQILREEIRKGTFLQSIAGRNYYYAISILEQNRFGLMDDLSMAESALKENIEIGDVLSLDSKFLLVEVYLHQGRMSTAQDQFALAQDGLSQTARNNNLFRVLHANAEIELALAEDRWNKAIEASSSSIEIYRDCHHNWGWARRLIDLGDALIGRNEPGDLEHARETYQQSLDMFTGMGAPGYIKVLEERLAGIRY